MLKFEKYRHNFINYKFGDYELHFSDVHVVDRPHGNYGKAHPNL